MKQKKLSVEASSELFRFGVEQLIRSIYPKMDRRTSHLKSLIFQQAIVGFILREAEEQMARNGIVKSDKTES